MQIEEIIQGKKGKLIIRAEGGLSFPLYEKEAAKYRLTEGGKLQENGYPEEIVECAMDYVKSFHYVDDYRYACTYIRYHQSEKSRLQIKMKLYERGVPSDLIEQALEDEYTGEEDRLIDRLLEKKQYDADTMDQKEKQKIYQYLMRRGFRSDAIRRRMNAE